MLRQGGWAVPLSCDHPLVQLWLRHVGVLQTAWCWVASGPGCEAAGRNGDASEQICTTFWTPFLLMTALGLGSLLWMGTCAWLIRKAIRRWYTGELHTGVARQAALAAKALQQKQAKALNVASVPHTWCKLARTSQHPVLCAVCFTEVAPGMGVKVKCCEVCGIAVHSLCRHLVASNCKPVAMRGARVLHHWLPAACVVENEYNATDSVLEGQTSLCMYCREPCVGMLLPVEEPIWQCTWCQQVCHVRCHSREHAVLKPPKPKTRGSKKKNRNKLGRHPQSCTNLSDPDWQSGGLGARRPSAAFSLDGGGGGGSGQEEDAALQPIRLGSSDFASAAVPLGKAPRKRKSQGLREQKGHARRSSQDFSNGTPRGSSGSERPSSYDDGMLGRRSASWVADAALRSPEITPLATPRGLPPKPANLSISGGDSDNKEVCRLGLVGRMVLPPTSVAEVQAEDENGVDSAPSSPTAAAAGGGSSSSPSVVPPEDLFAAGALEASPASWTSRAMKAGKQASLQANELLEGLYRKGRSHIHRPSVKAYTISALSPWHRPLLVFINTKSGPQVGSGLRRWFLRAFNPLQVVELPREEPMSALRLFSTVSNLRILVVGGDGSVGWILGCIDTLKREKGLQYEAELHEWEEGHGSSGFPPTPWTPPPVGVLPLGTGNDLARCLNWGGGIYTVRESGMTALMYDLQRAAVVLLDRWNVAISSPSGGDKGASIQTVDKSMTNYLGLGVDAKAALDFHNTREQYPQWFQSQLGNKMWYGVVGASDLIGHSCASLPHTVRLEVDGLEVPLPDDIEGLMLLNISSYMGGVNLWTCGREATDPMGAYDMGAGGGSSSAPWQYGGTPLPGDLTQSMSDGIIEAVAVYGTWHLGQLQVGLSKAERLARGRHIRLVMEGTLPMQIDGEPWMQGPAQLDIHCKGQAFMLRRLSSNSAGVMASIVGEVLETCESNGVLSLAQRQAIIAELAARLGPML